MKPRILPVGVSFGSAILRSSWALLVLFAWPALVAAGEEAAPPEEKLPTGKEVIDRSIEAIGGKDAVGRIANRVGEGTLEIKGLGIQGKLTTYGARPNRSYTRVEFESLGAIEQGISLAEGVADGRVVWELNPFTGPRVKKGEEKEALLLLSHFDQSDFEALYEKIECVGIEEVDGEPCYRVDCYPKHSDGHDDKDQGAVEAEEKDKGGEKDKGEGTIERARPITTYYSQETGLPVKIVLTFPHQMGEIKVESLMSDYREVDGIKLAHRTVEKVLTLETHFTVTGYKHNVDLPADRFALPKQIQILVDLDKAEAEDKAAEKAEAKPKEEVERKPEKKAEQGNAGQAAATTPAEK